MILVTGAGGMLGGYLKDEKTYLRTDVGSLDITDLTAVRAAVMKAKPEWLYHLAAETDVDKCEVQVDHAYRVNALGTQNVALACREFDVPLVYISTAGIFDGRKPEPYTEFDAPGPGNVYGETKLAGERIVQQLVAKHFIIRAGWMIGGGPAVDKKFVGKMLHLLRERKEVSVVNDKIGSPTYAKDFAAAIPKITATGAYGVYHRVNLGVASRYDIALEIVRQVKSAAKIIPVPSAAFPLAAPRVRSEAMRNFKLDLMGMNDARPWQDALREYLGEWAGEK